MKLNLLMSSTIVIASIGWFGISWGMEDKYFDHTRIPDPSNFSYPPASISHNTLQMIREQNEAAARLEGLSAYMNTNSFGMENMGDNFPITFNPASLEDAYKAYNNYRAIPEIPGIKFESPAPYFNPWANNDKPDYSSSTFNCVFFNEK